MNGWWALVTLCAVIIGCGAMTWYRPWWYQTRGTTRYFEVEHHGVVIYGRIIGGTEFTTFEVDRVTQWANAEQVPEVKFGEPFTLHWTEGQKVAEMQVTSITTSEGITEAVARDTETIRSRDR